MYTTASLYPVRHIYNVFQTKYGMITLFNNDKFIGDGFKAGKYWEEHIFEYIKEYICPDRNILEIGGHCGTSSLMYASLLHDPCKVYVYEPQKRLFDLLCLNVCQNNLQDKIIPFHSGVFCYSGTGNMTDSDPYESYASIENRYTSDINLPCNFGGVCLGTAGEPITLTTIDEMGLENIGFIACDAQGAESFIFSKGVSLLRRCKPVILYENNKKYCPFLYNAVCDAYPKYKEGAEFDVIDFCTRELGYTIINQVGLEDDLLLPPGQVNYEHTI